MSASPQKSRFAGAASSVPLFLTRGDVARYLGVNLRTLTWWLWALNEERRYYEFTIARRTGGEPRTIRAPIKPIKDFQRDLLRMLEGAYEPRPHVHGFVRGKSPLTNAAMHRNQRWILGSTSRTSSRRSTLAEFGASLGLRRSNSQTR